MSSIFFWAAWGLMVFIVARGFWRERRVKNPKKLFGRREMRNDGKHDGLWFAIWLILGLLLLGLGAKAQTPKTPPLELKVEDGRGARCVLKPIIYCGLIPTDEHGSIIFEYNPDTKHGWIRINRPAGDSLFGYIDLEGFKTFGNQGTLAFVFTGIGERFSGAASFTIYPFRYNYTNPGQHAGGIMLTSGAVRVTFHEEAQ